MAPLEHHVEIDPPEHHLGDVVGEAHAQKIEGPEAREGKLARQRLNFIVEIEKGPLLVTGDDNSGGVAVVVRPGRVAVDLPFEIFRQDIGLVMGHGPGLGGGQVGGVADDINIVELFGP